LKDPYLMETEIPVVIAHFGNKPNYLKLALQSAANFNKTVVLIGDDTNKGFWRNHWEAVPGKLDKFQEFQKHYVHMSSTGQEYEVACFRRMFALEEWMKENAFNRAFHLDSDVMTFADYSKEVCPLLPQDCIAALMAVERELLYPTWIICCHFSYWTLGALEDYTTFCINAYRNKTIRDKLEAKWQWHLDNNKGGGISDMTLLYFWAQGNPRIINFTKVYNGMTADHNFNLSEQYYVKEYKMQFGLKKFIFKEGIPYGYNKLLNKWIRFLCIHCQGAGKYAMPFLSHRHLRRFYVVTRILYRIRSKYFRFSCRKFKKFMSRG